MVATTAPRLLDLREGWVDDRLIEDEALYDVELERIFAEDWTLVAHEQQLPSVGDYVTTYVGEDPLVVVRHADGQVAAFLNSCRHRGLQVCRSASGNAARFACANHGWTYAITGELRSIGDQPAEPLVGPGIGLVPIAHLTIHDGWIMVSWSEGQPPGSPWQQLGPVAPVAPPQRVRLSVNWKTAAIRLRELIGGDAGHTTLAGPYVSAATGTVHTLQPRGFGQTELTTWRLDEASSAADALAARLNASDLRLDLLPEINETRVSLRRSTGPAPAHEHDDHHHDDHHHADGAPSCAPPTVAQPVVRRRLADSTATGVYAAWLERLDDRTRQRLGVAAGAAAGVA